MLLNGAATYANIEASTAENTLVLGSGAKVKNLVVNQGNVAVNEGSELDKIDIAAEVQGVNVINGGGNIATSVRENEKVTLLDSYAEGGFLYNCKTEKYEISTLLGLKYLINEVNNGNDFTGKTVCLTANLDLFQGYMDDGDPITTKPIADKATFCGTFDGQGHTISNLYQNGWALGYEWGIYGSLGLFSNIENATIKNLVIDGMEALVEGGDISFIAGSAKGTCVFENITIKNSKIGTYNNGCGGIIGWSGDGNYTFKHIKLENDVVLAGLWGSFDSSIGGIVGQAEPGATYNFEDVEINCRLDAYNDCTASYDYYNYRMCGMVIGRCMETTTIDGCNYPDLSKYNLSFTNVVVNYGDWMNYHYCRAKDERAKRVEAGYAYGGIAGDYDHNTCTVHHMEWIPFNQLIGGDQEAVKGLSKVDNVIVNYPDSYNEELKKSKEQDE